MNILDILFGGTQSKIEADGVYIASPPILPKEPDLVEQFDLYKDIDQLKIGIITVIAKEAEPEFTDEDRKAGILLVLQNLPAKISASMRGKSKDLIIIQPASAYSLRGSATVASSNSLWKAVVKDLVAIFKSIGLKSAHMSMNEDAIFVDMEEIKTAFNADKLKMLI